MSLAFIAGLTVIHAKAQTAEETLAKIEKDFAACRADEGSIAGGVAPVRFAVRWPGGIR